MFRDIHKYRKRNHISIALNQKDMRTLLKNGKIYDGTGKDAFAGDILIEDEKIAAVGPAIDETADEVIDLEGLAHVVGRLHDGVADARVDGLQQGQHLPQPQIQESGGSAWADRPAQREIRLEPHFPQR